MQTIIKNYNTRGNVENLRRSGRPRILSARDSRSIIKKIKKNPRLSAPKLAEDILREAGKTVNPETVRRVLINQGYNGRNPRRKPFISQTNMKKRREFAERYKNETAAFWQTVLFSDESKFNIFGCDGKGKIWRKVGQELAPNNLTPTVKHGGGNVMVWGCMAASGVGQLVFIEDRMDHRQYLDILRNNLRSSVETLELPTTWMFYQDNDPKHTAKAVKEWLIYNVPKQVNPPPQSPDLNAIEHIWDELERRIRKSNITSRESLKKALSTSWAEISADVTRNLVLSMPRRLQAVIESNEGPTKY